MWQYIKRISGGSDLNGNFHKYDIFKEHFNVFADTFDFLKTTLKLFSRHIQTNFIKNSHSNFLADTFTIDWEIFPNNTAHPTCVCTQPCRLCVHSTLHTNLSILFAYNPALVFAHKPALVFANNPTIYICTRPCHLCVRTTLPLVCALNPAT